MASTPSDLVIEVLSWLPAKSLMRFKSVSKHWYSLILSRIFVELHQTRSYTRADGVNLVLPPRYYSLDHPFLVIKAAKSNPIGRPIIHKPYTPNWPDTATNIVNGLVCFYHQTYNGCIYVYNLTTREYLPLPPTRGATMCSFKLNNLRKCLLGFDPTNNEYKVVHFWATSNSWVQCEVFTIGDKYGTWRKINVSEFSKTWHVALSSLCLDGVVYWIWQFRHIHRIIAFNVEHEKFDSIRYPPEELSGVILTQYGGRFSLAGISTSSNDVEITLWRLLEWKDKELPLWSKQVIVCPFSSGLGEIRCSHSGQAFLMRSSVSNGFIIESYDLETGEYVEIELEKVEGILGLNYGFSPLKVVDNIIPLKNITAKDMRKLSFLTCAREVGFPQLNIASDN